ncbi:sulfate permease [bacterium]|nr:sulfate permease [bacterium]
MVKTEHFKSRRSFSSLIPIIDWFPRYDRTWLRADLVAGLAVWAMTVPQALGYAGIAGVPPVYGLYAVPLAMVAYAIFGTSRTLCVGPESAIAIISAATVGGLTSGSAADYLTLTSLLTLIVGTLYLLFGLLRLGWAANFLAQPVMKGLTVGVALTVIVGQFSAIFGTQSAVSLIAGELRNIPQVLGLELAHNGFVLQTWSVLATLGNAHIPTTVVGLSCLVLLFAFRHFRPFAPSALIAVVLAVSAVVLFDLEGRGVMVMGVVEKGMVPLSLPAMDLKRAIGLLPGAFAIVLLGYSISLSVANLGAQKTGEEIDSNQELVALGMANMGAAFSSGFVACGSLSRGSVIMRAGGRTQVVSLINAALVILTLLFALPLFYKLPNATLNAVVITAMYGLLDLGYFRRLFHIDRGEFAYGMAALFGVLLLGILQGVVVGVILALAVLIHRVSHPVTATLGRLPGTENYRDITLHPDAETIPGMLIFRFDAPVIFINASYFAEEVRRFMGQAEATVREVLVLAQQISELDSTGADQLARLQAELATMGITLAFAEVKDPLREAFRRTGLEEKIGVDRFYESTEDGVREFLQHRNLIPDKKES